MPLTELEIRQAQPKAKDWKLSDAGGLYLLIRPNGSRLWRLKFRSDGKEQKLSFGAYPAVGLKEARLRRDEARVEIGRGGNPARRKREEKISAAIRAGDRFEDIAIEYINKCAEEGYATSTVQKANWFLDLLRPSIGTRPVAEITPHELLIALKKIERRGHRETARRTRSFSSRVFRYAVATLRAQHDPAQPLKGALIAPITKHYAAITDAAGFGELLRAIETYDGSIITRYALQIAPHVFVRPGELRHAEWCEFDFEGAVWKIPSEKMKSRRPHAVPLSQQVMRLLTDLKELKGDRGYVFSSLTSFKRPMSENTINAAFRRLGFSSSEMTAHGLRSSASTLLNESGLWSHDAIERALAHQDANAIRGIYHRGQHWDERVQMAQWWSDHLDSLKSGGITAKLRLAAG